MSTAAEVAVTLSPQLLTRLRNEAARLGVTLEWMVAALVADTLEARTDRSLAA
jgi:hypothetical protein